MRLLPFSKTPLEKALQRYMDDADGEELDALDSYRPRSRREGEAIVQALRRFERVPQRPEEGYRTSPLHRLAALFQQIEGERAFEVLNADGTRELARIARASFPPREDDHDDFPFLLKILVMHAAAGAPELVELAARHPATHDFYLWSVILSQLDDAHPLTEPIVAALRDPLPEGFAGIAFLDLANARARNGHADAHPFNTAEGLERIASCLTDASPEHYSYALSAAAAIPFLRTPARQRLIELAWEHADYAVRLEGYWAAAKLGDDRGVSALAEAAGDARKGSRAVALLEELGRLEAAPAVTPTAEYAALTELAEWLAYPTEFGAFPDALRVYDTRELFWPPTNDRRRLWLIEYTYEPSEDRETRDVGIGMVGSITFALFGETTAEMSPEDLYGIHCAWELETNGDPRAPEERTAAAGRRLLRI